MYQWARPCRLEVVLFSCGTWVKWRVDWCNVCTSHVDDHLHSWFLHLDSIPWPHGNSASACNFQSIWFSMITGTDHHLQCQHRLLSPMPVLAVIDNLSLHTLYRWISACTKIHLTPAPMTIQDEFIRPTLWLTARIPATLRPLQAAAPHAAMSSPHRRYDMVCFPANALPRLPSVP